MGPSPETSHAGLVCVFYINSVGPHYFYTYKFPKQTCKCLLYLHTPFTTALLHSHFFPFLTLCNVACIGRERIPCRHLGVHVCWSCFLNHSRPPVLSNPSSCWLEALQIQGLICFHKRFLCWMSKWHCIAGTVNGRALCDTKRSRHFVHSAQPSFGCIHATKLIQRSEEYSKVLAPLWIMPGSLAGETLESLKSGRRLFRWTMCVGSGQTIYLFC